MTPEILAIIMFITTLALLLFGFPVAFTLAGSALLFAFIGDFLDIFNFRMLFFFPQRIYGIMINEALVAVPLFIFMGVMLEKTKIASKLLDSIGDLFGSIRGGLGIGVVLVGIVFFLFPLLYIIWIFSYPFVYKSWQMNEISREAGGLSMLYLLKFAILLFVILLYSSYLCFFF